MSPTKLFGYCIVGIVALGGLGIVASTVGTIGSVATAPGRVISKTLETNNIISSYERFRDLNKVFDARVAQLRAHKKALDAETDPKERVYLRTEFFGQQQSCRDIAARYNADASKMNKAIFRADAPESLNAAACEV
ncbi:hypothetical protein [Methylobacterium sp. AMS5]|uniref:hypothetical protein n=1 Tax=Methylobacterium sp. AMS5 TaxID=925818 RepID=UPI00074FA2D2|nr:hypothetical protein [Methylobacterium sp. AMS5]AMB48348.1 hypothetical protein Y590_25605 [Methylobacterium sp. AMS5]